MRAQDLRGDAQRLERIAEARGQTAADVTAQLLRDAESVSRLVRTDSAEAAGCHRG